MIRRSHSFRAIALLLSALLCAQPAAVWAQSGDGGKHPVSDSFDRLETPAPNGVGGRGLGAKVFQAFRKLMEGVSADVSPGKTTEQIVREGIQAAKDINNGAHLSLDASGASPKLTENRTFTNRYFGKVQSVLANDWFMNNYGAFIGLAILMGINEFYRQQANPGENPLSADFLKNAFTSPELYFSFFGYALAAGAISKGLQKMNVPNYGIFGLTMLLQPMFSQVVSDFMRDPDLPACFGSGKPPQSPVAAGNNRNDEEQINPSCAAFFTRWTSGQHWLAEGYDSLPALINIIPETAAWVSVSALITMAPVVRNVAKIPIMNHFATKVLYTMRPQKVINALGPQAEKVLGAELVGAAARAGRAGRIGRAVLVGGAMGILVFGAIGSLIHKIPFISTRGEWFRRLQYLWGFGGWAPKERTPLAVIQDSFIRYFHTSSLDRFEWDEQQMSHMLATKNEYLSRLSFWEQIESKQLYDSNQQWISKWVQLLSTLYYAEQVYKKAILKINEDAGGGSVPDDPAYHVLPESMQDENIRPYFQAEADEVQKAPFGIRYLNMASADLIAQRDEDKDRYVLDFKHLPELLKVYKNHFPGYDLEPPNGSAGTVMLLNMLCGPDVDSPAAKKSSWFKRKSHGLASLDADRPIFLVGRGAPSRFNPPRIVSSIDGVLSICEKHNLDRLGVAARFAAHFLWPASARQVQTGFGRLKPEPVPNDEFVEFLRKNIRPEFLGEPKKVLANFDNFWRTEVMAPYIKIRDELMEQYNQGVMKKHVEYLSRDGYYWCGRPTAFAGERIAVVRNRAAADCDPSQISRLAKNPLMRFDDQFQTSVSLIWEIVRQHPELLKNTDYQPLNPDQFKDFLRTYALIVSTWAQNIRAVVDGRFKPMQLTKLEVAAIHRLLPPDQRADLAAMVPLDLARHLALVAIPAAKKYLRETLYKTQQYSTLTQNPKEREAMLANLKPFYTLLFTAVNDLESPIALLNQQMLIIEFPRMTNQVALEVGHKLDGVKEDMPVEDEDGEVPGLEDFESSTKNQAPEDSAADVLADSSLVEAGQPPTAKQ